MAGFERSIRDVSETRDFWKAFTPIPDIHVDTAAVVRAWTAARESVLEILRAKAVSPLEPMKLPDQAVEAVAAFDEQRRSVAEAFDVNGGAKTGHGAEQKSATREGMGLKRRERFAPRQLRFSDSWRLPGRFCPAGQT